MNIINYTLDTEELNSKINAIQEKKFCEVNIHMNRTTFMVLKSSSEKHHIKHICSRHYSYRDIPIIFTNDFDFGRIEIYGFEIAKATKAEYSNNSTQPLIFLEDEVKIFRHIK
jgi:hypothetical protein